jgi:hypothetical protein
MISPRRALGWRLALVAAILGLYACTNDGSVAGGSSEVDNPQVLVAFVNASGEGVTTTGSLGVYLAGQSPALNPDPIVEIQLNGTDSVRLTASLLSAAGVTDSIRSFNLYMRGDDSTGGFFQSISYNPVTKKFSQNDSLAIERVSLTVSPLIRSESVLKGVVADSTGLNRIIIPGSPFQAVVVDSVFVFEEIPAGIYTVHVLEPDGREIPLPEPMDTDAPKYHNVNPDTVPVVRPPPPPPPSFQIDAGSDRTVSAGTETHLSGEIRGVDSRDKRLAVLWRQLPAAHPEAVAIIERPSSLRTDVYFPRSGAYTFVLSVAIGNQQVQDTVVIGVQPAPENPTFIEPSMGDTLVFGQFFKLVWQSPRQEFLSIELSQDSGSSWTPVSMGYSVFSKAGFNEFYWVPWYPLIPSPNCFVRLTRGGQVATTSQRFVLVAAPPPPDFH